MNAPVDATPEPASNKRISASAELPTDPASNAFDGNLETIWNSGQDAEGWIQIDLDQMRMITSIRLIVAQYPEGETVHQIWGGDSESNLQLLHEFSGHTVDSQILLFDLPSPLENIRFIRVMTTRSPSWVAWREIEVVSP